MGEDDRAVTCACCRAAPPEPGFDGLCRDCGATRARMVSLRSLKRLGGVPTHQVEDLVQDALGIALVRFDPDHGGFVAFVRGIAKNLRLQHFDKMHRDRGIAGRWKVAKPKTAYKIGWLVEDLEALIRPYGANLFRSEYPAADYRSAAAGLLARWLTLHLPDCPEEGRLKQQITSRLAAQAGKPNDPVQTVLAIALTSAGMSPRQANDALNRYRQRKVRERRRIENFANTADCEELMRLLGFQVDRLA